MFRFAILFLIISLIAGAVGMTNVSALAKRVSLILFGLFFLGFLALLGFAYLLGAAFNAGQQSMLLGAMSAQRRIHSDEGRGLLIHSADE
jgi:uncharacterized membrane protein YtjA (UPF0391 family)